jgi:UPF0755 protein
MKKNIRTLRYALLAGAAVVLLAALGYWLYLEHFARTPSATDLNAELTIEVGTNPRQISRMLEEEGLVSSATNFYIYLRFVARKASLLKAGDYDFKGKMTPLEIIELLQKGLRREMRLTVPEGATKVEIADIVAKEGLANKDEFLAAMESPELLEEFGVPNVGAGGQREGVAGGIEGYLFPDTYQFPKGTPSLTILRRMHERLVEVIDPEMLKRMEQMGWSLHQVLTLAAIVEKETGQRDERPQIASVFFNRLKKRMRLQTDPTVVYAIDMFNGKIGKKHLALRHPYNTYLNAGLPPGPIASPGLAAIRAVLWPANTRYFYFVSKNDGTHQFCDTYACHQKAVRLWQINFFKKPTSAVQLPDQIPST